MSRKGEYVIDHWYFFRHAEVCKKRYRADTLEEAKERLDKLASLGTTSRVRISKQGMGRKLSVISVWQAP